MATYAKTLFLALCLSTPAARPKQNIEFWFLSPPKTNTQTLIYPLAPTRSKQLLVFASGPHQSCSVMGDQYFHPQFGVHVFGHTVVQKKHQAPPLGNPKAIENKFLTSGDHDLISCDKNYYFDLYCGKAKMAKRGKPSGFSIWVDTSSSLRQVDFSANLKDCQRKSFVKKVQQSCGNKSIDISLFDTSIKSMGSLDGLCRNYGLNDSKRLLQWIKSFKGKSLIVITDISEYSQDLTDELDLMGVTYRGHQTKSPLFAKDLHKFIAKASRFCR